MSQFKFVDWTHEDGRYYVDLCIGPDKWRQIGRGTTRLAAVQAAVQTAQRDQHYHLPHVAEACRAALPDLQTALAALMETR